MHHLNFFIEQLFFPGMFILGVAVLANALAAKIGLMTWYTFLEYVSDITIIDGLWLFILYPLCLGLGALLGNHISDLLFK